jgi:hypothetical protein
LAGRDKAKSSAGLPVFTHYPARSWRYRNT